VSLPSLTWHADTSQGMSGHRSPTPTSSVSEPLHLTVCPSSRTSRLRGTRQSSARVWTSCRSSRSTLYVMAPTHDHTEITGMSAPRDLRPSRTAPRAVGTPPPTADGRPWAGGPRPPHLGPSVLSVPSALGLVYSLVDRRCTDTDDSVILVIIPIRCTSASRSVISPLRCSSLPRRALTE
jgi:hypothetical protein